MITVKQIMQAARTGTEQQARETLEEVQKVLREHHAESVSAMGWNDDLPGDGFDALIDAQQELAEKFGLSYIRFYRGELQRVVPMKHKTGA